MEKKENLTENGGRHWVDRNRLPSGKIKPYRTDVLKFDKEYNKRRRIYRRGMEEEYVWNFKKYSVLLNIPENGLTWLQKRNDM